MAAAMKHALTMPPPDRRRRMAAMRDRVAARDVNWWAATFLSDLWSAAPDDGVVNISEMMGAYAMGK
jgi:trehalose-6-phosphate synthase